MLYLTLYTVGNVPKGPYQALVDEFKKILTRYARVDHRIVASLEGIQERIPEGRLLVLEATGKQLSSEQFASFIADLEARGEKVTVLIGGPFGIPSAIKKQADLLLSLSPMTMTHDFAIILFLEQLFRACSINAGTGYHK